MDVGTKQQPIVYPMFALFGDWFDVRSLVACFPKSERAEKAFEPRGRNLNVVLDTSRRRCILSHVREAVDNKPPLLSLAQSLQIGDIPCSRVASRLP
jgi:hypothetical protein